MTAVAFFDLDNTIIRGGSLFHFARGLQRRRFFSRGEVLNQVWKHLKFVVVGKEHLNDLDSIRRMTLKFAAGHRISEIEDLAREIVRETVLPKVYDQTRELIAGHLARGEEVWIVTASPQRIADLMATELGLTGAIGTIAEERDGLFTGELAGPILHGAAKADAAKAFAASRGLDLAACTAYSDSVNDLPLLESVGHPVVVNADRRLRAVARRRGWPAHDFRRLRAARKYGLPASSAIAAGLAAKWVRKRPR